MAGKRPAGPGRPKGGKVAANPGPAPVPAPGEADDGWAQLSQREKFIRTAREVGANETGEALDEALRAVARARKR
jgi:hypothetical protein